MHGVPLVFLTQIPDLSGCASNEAANTSGKFKQYDVKGIPELRKYVQHKLPSEVGSACRQEIANCDKCDVFCFNPKYVLQLSVEAKRILNSAGISQERIDNAIDREANVIFDREITDILVKHMKDDCSLFNLRNGRSFCKGNKPYYDLGKAGSVLIKPGCIFASPDYMNAHDVESNKITLNVDKNEYALMRMEELYMKTITLLGMSYAGDFDLVSRPTGVIFTPPNSESDSEQTITAKQMIQRIDGCPLLVVPESSELPQVDVKEISKLREYVQSKLPKEIRDAFLQEINSVPIQPVIYFNESKPVKLSERARMLLSSAGISQERIDNAIDTNANVIFDIDVTNILVNHVDDEDYLFVTRDGRPFSKDRENYFDVQKVPSVLIRPGCIFAKPDNPVLANDEYDEMTLELDYKRYAQVRTEELLTKTLTLLGMSYYCKEEFVTGSIGAIFTLPDSESARNQIIPSGELVRRIEGCPLLVVPDSSNWA